MKTLIFKQQKKLYLHLTAAIGAWLLLAGAAAATPLIAQGFFAKDKIPSGSIVSLRADSTDTAEPTTTKNVSNILGVVIDSSRPSVTLSAGPKNQVQVATSGVEQVLVSDLNGNIAAGDSITASPIGGVGMKATANTKIVGVAQGNFPNKTSSKQTYTDDKGQKLPVTLGEVPVLVNVAYYFKQPEKTIIPSAIQNIANALAGKKVDSLPIILSIGVFIVTMVAVVSIIYSMIRSSIISVGRNPMSQAAVYRNVIQLSTLVVVILVVAVAAIYMILRKF